MAQHSRHTSGLEQDPASSAATHGNCACARGTARRGIARQDRVGSPPASRAGGERAAAAPRSCIVASALLLTSSLRCRTALARLPCAPAPCRPKLPHPLGAGKLQRPHLLQDAGPLRQGFFIRAGLPLVLGWLLLRGFFHGHGMLYASLPQRVCTEGQLSSVGGL